MARNLISSGVADTRLGVYDEIISKQFDDLDLSAAMVYLIDVVHPSAFPFLANQLDVEGFKGYDQCTTDDQRRDLLKNAIKLHLKLGTIQSIRKACSIIGFEPEEIEEGVPIVTGGDDIWCAFRIKLNPVDLSTFSSETLSTLRTFINYYKNARSILTEIYFGVKTTDKIFTTQASLRDNLTIIGTIVTDGDYNTDYSYDYY